MVFWHVFPLRFCIHVKTGKNDSDLQFILSLYRNDIFLFHFQLTRVLSNVDLLGIYREMAHVLLGTDANLDLKREVCFVSCCWWHMGMTNSGQIVTYHHQEPYPSNEAGYDPDYITACSHVFVSRRSCYNSLGILTSSQNHVCHWKKMTLMTSTLLQVSLLSSCHVFLYAQLYFHVHRAQRLWRGRGDHKVLGPLWYWGLHE